MTVTCKLRNFDAYNNLKFISFDPENMEILYFGESGNPEINPSGFYYSGGSKPLGFFHGLHLWYFFVGKSVFSVNEVTRIDRVYHGKGRAEVDILLRSGNTIKADYVVGARIEGDPTPFIEEEDFDYGLFFENVILNEDRLNRISVAQLS